MGYYETLGVQKNADPETIRKAYRKLAMKHHPDRNKGKEEEAAKTFKEITSAFEILSDPLKRSDYDRGINVGGPTYRPHGPPPGWTPPKPPPPPPPPPKSEEVELSKIQVDVVPVKGRGSDIRMNVTLTSQEMKSGCRKTVTAKRHRMCRRCAADGKVMRTCPACASHKHFVGHCRKCEGYGAIEETCGICKGKGVESNWELVEMNAVFPPCHVGYVLTIVGCGETGLSGQFPGNVRLVVQSA